MFIFFFLVKFHVLYTYLRFCQMKKESSNANLIVS